MAVYQWREDVKRVEEIAVNAGVEGFAINPIEIIEMPCIFNRYERGDRAELINFAATALYPFDYKGSQAIKRFIAQAEKGGTR
jgi:hypothetical protein